jgi:hypothetical protein
MLRYSQFFGVAAALVLIISGFLPWTWHPDIQKYFTGFFSENNTYGKPGKVFIVLCAMAIVFFLIPRLWAKRFNLFFGAVILAYAIKCFIVYSGCYAGTCPVIQYGLWMMLISAMGLMLGAVLPDIKLKKEEDA